MLDCLARFVPGLPLDGLARDVARSGRRRSESGDLPTSLTQRLSGYLLPWQTSRRARASPTGKAIVGDCPCLPTVGRELAVAADGHLAR
jgi:hypothetical protein